MQTSSRLAELLILIMPFAALIGLFLAWAEWHKQLRLVEIQSWRKKTLSIGLFAVTLQALLFASMWTPLSRFHVLLQRFLNTDLLLLVLAIPCAFAWKGRIRWWLLTASIGFSVGCVFSAFAEMAY